MDKDKKIMQTMSIENDRVYNRILLLVNQAMEAFNKAKEAYGGDNMCLLTRDGELYGLTGPLKLGKNGYLYIPLRGALGEYSSFTPMKCKVFTKSNGKCVLYNDWYDESWNDARKALNKIIQDADRSCKHIEGWDPNWEDLHGKEKRDTINKFNKEAGFNKGTFTEGIDHKYPMPSEHAMVYISNPDGTCVAEITLDNIDSTDFTLHNYETGETIEHFLPGDATLEQMESKMRELFPDALQESYGYDEDNDNDDVTGTVDYVIDSVVNGNKEQAAREAAAVMSKGQLKDLLIAARETGDQNLEEKVWDAVSWGIAYI